MALILFLLAKVAWHTCSLCGTEATPFFWKAQYLQAFSLKPVPFCKLFAGLGSTNKSANSHLFSSYLTLALSSPPCFPLHLSSYLNLSGRSDKNCLLSPPVLLGYNRPLDTHSTQETMQLMRWPNEEHYLCPLQSLVNSFLLPLIFTLIFLGLEVYSSKFFNAQVSSISTKKFVLSCLTRSALSHLCCNKHSLLLNSLSL